MAEARDFALLRGGRFYVFGSAVKGGIRYDSDFDVVVDFPTAVETEAVEFIEEACRRRDLPYDVYRKSTASGRFLDRIRETMVTLP